MKTFTTPAATAAALLSFSLSFFLLTATTSICQAFIIPCRPVRHHHQALSKLYSSAGAMLGAATHPLANRKIQFSDNEDNTDRVTQVQLNADGTVSMLSDSTNAVSIQGNWKPAEDGKVGFILERFYSDSGDSSYSMTRIYEGVVTVSGTSIRGEGKIEMEKYSDVFTCGFFSLISVDDGPDPFFENLGPGHTVMKGVDQ